MHFDRKIVVEIPGNYYPDQGRRCSVITATNLCTISQLLTDVLDEDGQVDAVYTDFSDALDTIDHTDHTDLMSKLNCFGFAPSTLQLMRLY